MEIQGTDKYIYAALGDFKIFFPVEPIKIQELWQQFYCERKKKNALAMPLF